MPVERMHTAAADADFIIHIAEMERPPKEIAAIFDKILRIHGLRAVVHPLVYDKELDAQNPAVSIMFTGGTLQRLTFENDIFQADAAKEAYYRYLVPELYQHLTGNTLPAGQDILTYWRRQSSLGEIHSVAMCLICQFGLFLSDDGDSKFLKQIVEQRMLGQIQVYDRREILAQCTNAYGLSRSDRRAFTHQSKN